MKVFLFCCASVFLFGACLPGPNFNQTSSKIDQQEAKYNEKLSIIDKEYAVLEANERSLITQFNSDQLQAYSNYKDAFKQADQVKCLIALRQMNETFKVSPKGKLL